MIILNNTSQCTGCTACKAICPLNCINMIKNERGFFYPVIDTENCSECGLCQKICPENNVKEILFTEPEVYALKHKSDEVRLKSSSGGAFTALYDHIIDQGGVVFGVQFDDEFKVVHAKASTKEDCALFRGSKYVQSKKNDIFQEVKKELKTGKPVLFSGTPCEVAGLNAYLIKQYDNLITCDFICHGVPSPGIWEEYISSINQSNDKLEKFSFRYKDKGWHDTHTFQKFKSGKIIIEPLIRNEFAYLVFSNLIMRSCCHNCLYTNLQRPSDITMGDFWAIKKVANVFDDNKGISQILINTIKGEELFNIISNKTVLIKVSLQDSLQPNLITPTPINTQSKIFWEDYTNYGFKFILKKYKLRFYFITRLSSF